MIEHPPEIESHAAEKDPASHSKQRTDYHTESDAHPDGAERSEGGQKDTDDAAVNQSHAICSGVHWQHAQAQMIEEITERERGQQKGKTGCGQNQEDGHHATSSVRSESACGYLTPSSR